MKTRRTFTAILMAMLVMPFASCSKHEPKADAAPKDEKAAAESKGQKPTSLSAEEQKNAGIETGAIQAIDVQPESTVYGRVLDPAPLGAAVGEVTAALAASEASESESKRLETLANENNASQRQLQSGKAALAHDTAAVEAAKLKIVSAWGPALADRKNLSTLVTDLTSQKSALLQLNLSADAQVPAPGSSIRIVADDKTNSTTAQVLSAAPVVDPQLQGRGVIALVTNNSAHLTPGMAVTGYVAETGEPQHGFLLPDSALVRYSGAAWIYIQESSTNFSREPVLLKKPMTNGWFAQGDLKPDEKIVTRGAQAILSNELKSQTSPD